MGTGKLQEDDLDRPKTTALPGCSCFPQSEKYSYGLGIITSGNWILQNPFSQARSGSFAYLPSLKVAIAIAVTFTEEAFAPDGNGNYTERSTPRSDPQKRSATVLFESLSAPSSPPTSP